MTTLEIEIYMQFYFPYCMEYFILIDQSRYSVISFPNICCHPLKSCISDLTSRLTYITCVTVRTHFFTKPTCTSCVLVIDCSEHDLQSAHLASRLKLIYFCSVQPYVCVYVGCFQSVCALQK